MVLVHRGRAKGYGECQLSDDGDAWSLFFLFCFVFCLFAFSRAAPVAYGVFQARGLIGAVAAGLGQSHSNAGSELHLKPTPQLTAMPDS